MDFMSSLFFLIVVFAVGVAVGWWFGRQSHKARGRRPRGGRSRGRAPTAPEPEPSGPPVVLDRAFLAARAEAKKKPDEDDTSAG
ncbi:MAG: hypothetical protein FWF28_09375 [Micrococcales bacterium]|nr:hypothetical protein [Micrococcales bacterium]